MWQVTGIDRSSQKSGKIQEYTVVQRFIKDDGYYQSGKWQETIVARRNIEMTEKYCKWQANLKAYRDTVTCRRISKLTWRMEQQYSNMQEKTELHRNLG